MERVLHSEQLASYRKHLIKEEKSTATVKKYLRDAAAFATFVEDREIDKELILEYKKLLINKAYAVRSINSKLASLNSLMDFMGWADCRVKNLRIQRQAYCSLDKELTKQEYLRLLSAAKRQPQLYLAMQTICSTGIRISELKCFTVEALAAGNVNVKSKNKTRMILVPGKLRLMLLDFAQRNGIETGPVFVSNRGNPIDRSNIWLRMKKLCIAAQVEPSKVYPHNLRKLFARSFYGIDKDIAKLADVLGHESIETTRIYIVSTGAEHLKRIESLDLVQ